MSNRTERRAAERAARKLAGNQLKSSATSVIAAAAIPSAQPVHAPISPARLTANRANSQHSCGPVSAAGKAVSSLNALSHGLTRRTVVLAGEDSLEYNRRLESCFQHLRPANEQELRLVQSIVDCNWRLDRIQKIESAIYFKGSLEFAAQFEDQPPAHRECLILAEVYLKYEKSLRNLNIQEARLLSTMQKAQAELSTLQKMRHHDEEFPLAETEPRPSSGFDFSNAESACLPAPLLTEVELPESTLEASTATT